jgi:hypothetical protein
MSDTFFKDFITSGRKIIVDTKVPKMSNKVEKPPTVADSFKGGKPMNGYDVLIKRVIKELPSKKDLIQDFEIFIKQAEEME